MIILYVIAIVILFNLWAILQIFLRSWIYGAKLYKPMLWNIFLSWLPNIVLIIYLVLAVVSLLNFDSWLIMIVTPIFAIIWMLLLPNANYLITELNLNHRRENEKVPLWYDIISVLTLSITGVLNAVSSIVVINAAYVLCTYATAENLIPTLATDGKFWFVTVFVIMLSCFGIYIGRYTRVNSWDIKHPIKLVSKVWNYIVREKHIGDALLFVVFFTVFLLLVYLLFMSPAVALWGNA